MMNGRTLTGVLRAAGVTGGAFAMMGSAVLIAIGHAEPWWSDFIAFVAMFSVFFAVFVWLVIPNQPRNAVVWTMAASAFFGGLFVVGLAGVAFVVDDPRPVLVASEHVVPADLPAAAVWILMFTEPGSGLAFFPLLTFGLLLFPDGKMPSRRWRWVGGLAAISILATTIAFAWGYRPGNTLPADESPILDTAFVALFLAIILSLAALIVRFRGSNGATRQQFKWVVWGASIFAPVMVASVTFGGTRNEGLITAPLLVAGAIFLGSYGIAVGKYHLFDIDVVISRTVVVAGLAGFITAVYSAVVGGIGLLFGTGTGADLPLSVAATVLVAIAFQPLRTRLRRWADRLVYGERATPYEVLSRFSAQMRDAVATEDVVPQMARLLAAGTGAQQATVWMKSDDELRPVATWPSEDDAVPVPVEVNNGEPSIPGVDRLARVEHDGELLGALTVTKPRGEAMTATEQRLMDDVASQAGLVLRNARLTADLFDTIQQLRSSRQRMVAAQDEERRRLERNLHDGAQQQLVALKIKAAMAQRLFESGDSDHVAALLGQVVADTTDAVESLRDLAHGIYPPLLEAEGLEAALEARARKAPVAVSVFARGLGRYSAGVEAAVYFCVLEAIQNTVKYARADKVSVSLRQEEGRLVFEVADDGIGFDSETQTPGRGLLNMADRLDAVGGALEVRSAPGEGTTVTGSLDGVVATSNEAARETRPIPAMPAADTT